jgi:Domain of unknown function (DUF4136)
MRNIARTLAIGLFAVAMLGAPILAQTPSIDYDHTVNFLKFKTYTWQRVHATDPDVEARITLAVNRSMKGRYMTEVASGGDVTITAFTATKDKQEATSFYSTGLGDFAWQRPWGSGGFLDSQATVEDVPMGTLIIDMYDTKSHKLLWRGTYTLSPADAASKDLDQKLDKASSELIGKYPPKFKK